MTLLRRGRLGGAGGAGIGQAIGGIAGGGVGRCNENREAALRAQLAGVEGADVRRNLNMLAVTFKSGLLFDVDSSTVKAGSCDEIARVGQVLNQYPQTTIIIAGHADATGGESYNQRLSERRSDSVKHALASRGVSPMRMSVIDYGETRPVASNSIESGRQANRRVEINITPML